MSGWRWEMEKELVLDREVALEWLWGWEQVLVWAKDWAPELVLDWAPARFRLRLW